MTNWRKGEGGREMESTNITNITNIINNSHVATIPYSINISNFTNITIVAAVAYSTKITNITYCDWRYYCNIGNVR